MTCKECIANLKRYKENPLNPTRNGWHYGRKGKYKKAKAIIESLSYNSPMKDKSKFSANLKGCGAFEPVTEEPSPVVARVSK